MFFLDFFYQIIEKYKEKFKGLMSLSCNYEIENVNQKFTKLLRTKKGIFLQKKL
jgi:hypothetical protein